MAIPTREEAEKAKAKAKEKTTKLKRSIGSVFVIMILFAFFSTDFKASARKHGGSTSGVYDSGYSEWVSVPFDNTEWIEIHITPPYKRVETKVYGDKPIKWQFRLDGDSRRVTPVNPGEFPDPQGDYSRYEYSLRGETQNKSGRFTYRLAP